MPTSAHPCPPMPTASGQRMPILWAQLSQLQNDRTATHCSDDTNYKGTLYKQSVGIILVCGEKFETSPWVTPVTLPYTNSPPPCLCSLHPSIRLLLWNSRRKYIPAFSLFLACFFKISYKTTSFQGRGTFPFKISPALGMHFLWLPWQHWYCFL